MTEFTVNDEENILDELTSRAAELYKWVLQGKTGYRPSLEMYTRAIRRIESLEARIDELEDENMQLRVNGP